LISNKPPEECVTDVTEDQLQQQRVHLVARIREVTKANSLLDGTNLEHEIEENDDKCNENYEEDLEDLPFEEEGPGQHTRTVG
jgi:hypothetical protein